MKNYLKSAAVVALSVGMLIGLTGAASADGVASTGGSYVGVYGGANWDDVSIPRSSMTRPAIRSALLLVLM